MRTSALRGVMLALVLTAATLPVSGCGIFTQKCTNFAYSLAPNVQGAATPLLAAEQWAINYPDGAPPLSGWSEVSSNSEGKTLKSGDTTVHVVQVSGGTWMVDSGKYCH